MLDKIKKFEKMSIATSILLIIFSLFLIFKPEASLTFIVVIIGIVEFRAMSLELIEGTVYTIIGLFFIFKPSILNEFLGIIVGIWLVIQFIIKFQFAFNLKSVASPAWSLMLISSLLHLAFGIGIILNPFASVVTITTLTGIVLLISEIGNLAESIYLLRKNLLIFYLLYILNLLLLNQYFSFHFQLGKIRNKLDNYY